MRETDHMLQVLQESLTELEKQLTTYLTDRIDAFQVPQEAQVIPQLCKVFLAFKYWYNEWFLSVPGDNMFDADAAIS